MALAERDGATTVPSVLAERVAAAPDSPFLVWGDVSLTFADVDHLSAALAISLSDLGVEAGDRVALMLPSRPEFVVALLAAARLGAVVVPLEPRMAPGEMQYMLRHSEAVVAVAMAHLGGVDYFERFDDLIDQLPSLRHVVTVGDEDGWFDDRILRYDDLVTAAATSTDSGSYPAPDDLLALVYTAGTTGKPKGVELSHAALLHATRATCAALELSPADRVAGVPALFHVFGLGPGVLGSVLSGAALVLTDRREPGGLLDLVEAEGITVLHGLPTVFTTEMAEQRHRPRDVSTLRLGVAAGAAVPEDLVRRVEAELCPVCLVAYAMTETGSTVAMTRAADTLSARRTTVGRPIAGTDVRILEDGVPLPVESIGEIAVRGPGLMQGYYRQPRETASSIDAEGYLRTGDLGMIDDEGYLHLVGGNDEVIFRAGFKFYPRPVEDRILSHPAVDEAVVVGVGDAVLGQATCACVIPVEGAMLTPDEIRDWCAEALAPDSVPDRVRFVEGFPRAVTGRIRRSELTAMLSDSVTVE